MFIKKALFMLIILVLIIGCKSSIFDYNKNLNSYDDSLIEKIQDATNKIEIGYDDLPINIISTIEKSYNNKSFLFELKANGLGYELVYSDFNTDETYFKKIYFNLEGRKLISKKDYNKRDSDCFELIYPVTFIMPDDSSITIVNEEDWEDLKKWYDENPDSDERPSLQYPINLVFEGGNTIIINDNNEMSEAKSNCIDCIELVYPVTFILPDGSLETVDYNNDESWIVIKNWYEENPNTEFNWNFQYPVDIILNNGTIISVNSLNELDMLKQECN